MRKHPKVNAAITLSVKANIVLALDKNVFILKTATYHLLSKIEIIPHRLHIRSTRLALLIVPASTNRVSCLLGDNASSVQNTSDRWGMLFRRILKLYFTELEMNDLSPPEPFSHPRNRCGKTNQTKIILLLPLLHPHLIIIKRMLTTQDIVGTPCYDILDFIFNFTGNFTNNEKYIYIEQEIKK